MTTQTSTLHADFRELPEAGQSMLVRVLATTDALFTPYRPTRHSDAWKTWPAVDESRSYFRRWGVPLAGGGDAQTRKAAERLRARLEDGGFLRISHHGSRNLSGRLTDAGESLLRQLVASYTVAESWWALERLDSMVAAGDCAVWLGASYVRIYELAGTPPENPDRKSVLRLEDILLAPAARDYVDTNSDSRGVVWVHPTREGREALLDGPPEDVALLEGRKFTTQKKDRAERDRLFREHNAIYHATLREREKWKPPRPNMLHVPVSCGLDHGDVIAG